MENFNFGTKFDNHGSETTDATIKSSKVVAIYFSAHWCPPCRGFTPTLASFYKTANANGQVMEIIFASSDQDEKQFEEYFNTMPWIALPYSDRDTKNSCASHVKVTGIPRLVVLKSDGTVIVDNARSEVAACGGDAEKIQELCELWASA